MNSEPLNAEEEPRCALPLGHGGPHATSAPDPALARLRETEALDGMLRHIFARIGSLRTTGDWPTRRRQVLGIITDERAALAATPTAPPSTDRDQRLMALIREAEPFVNAAAGRSDSARTPDAIAADMRAATTPPRSPEAALEPHGYEETPG